MNNRTNNRMQRQENKLKFSQKRFPSVKKMRIPD